MVKIILHCSDSSFANATLITRWHLERGFRTIGYHYVILNGFLDAGVYHANFNGHVETGRALDDDSDVNDKEMGAHVLSHNKGSIGICLVGKSNSFTDEQLNGSVKLIYSLEQQYKEIEIVQHSTLDPKKPFCAGLDMELYLSNYEKYKRLVSQG